MRQVRAGSLFALWIALAAVGCDSSGPSVAGSEGFESDVPAAGAGGRGSDDSEDGSDTSANPGTAEPGEDFDGARAIIEADIIQVQGERLYALSRVAGLSVIDVSDPSALKLLGRYRELPATPFEMYLKDGVALVMFTSWGQYVELDDGSYGWVSTSKLLALDVQDPANITQLGSFDVPGSISDSRMVGDVLYIVGHEDGSCWRCEQNKPRTAIVSLRVADPRDVSKVDELFYEDAKSSWGQRSVTVTTQRMYVAGPEYGQDMPTGSTIELIDISDQRGALVKGTSVKVEGQVNSRWQMDEYNGVLRVVSQPPQWWTQPGPVTMKPAIETFKVESSLKLSPLGRTDIELPPNETLRSVRFDGERGYAITAEQKDPLFTLDLKDPAQPRVAGMLKIPGFVYHMEPRGNRVLGLGFDQGNAAGSITVALFDVTDMAKPAELSRVSFGGNWGSLPEDQNRIHKAFRVLVDAGLILVPFSGWTYSVGSNTQCYFSEYDGGVQIIDFANDRLRARGAAPSEVEPRRALLVADALLSVSDQRVQAFDISDRDMPKQISQVVLSRTVYRAVQLDNGVVARFSAGNDGAPRIDFVQRADVEDPNKSEAELSLSELTGGTSKPCQSTLSLDETFVHGSTLEVLYDVYDYSRSDGQNMNSRGLVVLDASDASNPKRVANVTWQLDQWSPFGSYYRYGYYGERSSSLRTANALATLESRWDDSTVSSTQRVRLRVLDLRDLDNVHNTVLPFEPVGSFSGLHADGDVVMTSHLAATSQDARRGRFYIDRVDISKPEDPQELPSINVPGALALFDSASGRALTAEQVRVDVADKITADECYKRFADADWRTTDVAASAASGGASTDAGQVAEEAPTVGKCTGYKQRLSLVHFEGASARLDDRIELPENQQMFSLSEGDGVAFASVGRGGAYDPFTSDGADGVACRGACGGGAAQGQPTELLVLGGFGAGKLLAGHLTVDDAKSNGWYGFWGAPPVYAYGKRALLIGRSDAAIIDASTVTQPLLVKRLPLLGSVQYAEVREQSALLALAQQGVQWLDLRD